VLDVAKLPFFWGSLSSDSTNGILKPKRTGSFLIRFSSVPGNFETEKNKEKH